MTSHLSIYVIINLKFSIVKLPKGIMAERSVLVKRELISNLPQARRSQRETKPNICDFSRCRLNVRLPARIQPLLRGHKYRISYLFSGCLWLDFDWIKIVVVGIWGRGQKFSACSQNIVNRYFFILLLHIGRSNHTLYSQSFSSKQKTSASVPKSPPPV